MPEIIRPYSGKYPPFHNYLDLSGLADDKTVLRNPHKGFYWHFIDNGFGRENYRQNLVPGDYMTDFPGLNHLYLRFDWGDIEKAEGELDWSYIDSIMDEWGARGYRFSMRICTYEGGGKPESIKYATPKWVYDAGAEYIELSGDRLEPVYSDPIYLEKLENFMRRYGEKFNSDSRVEFIDIGSFGTYGEAHTFTGSEKIYPDETIRKHIELHAKYFPDKFILLNDDMIGHRKTESEEKNQALLEYAKTLGTGARDDSICVNWYSKTYGFDTLRSPCLFDQLYENAPVDIEFAHYSYIIGNSEVFRDGFPFIEALRRAHATYAGFHGLPRPWLEKFYYLTEYLANRLGYWFFIDGMRLTPFTAGCKNNIDIIFINHGFAKCYNKFDLRLRLSGVGGEYSFDAPDCDCRRWLPDEPAKERITLDTRALPAGEYTLSVGLFEGETPIKLAVQSDFEHEGLYNIAKVRII